jgi:hypothetical protein
MTKDPTRCVVLRPKFYRSNSLDKVSLPAHFMYGCLLTISDCQGIFDASAEELRLYLGATENRRRQFSQKKINEYLEELEATDHIYLYEVDNHRYGWIPTFRVHQTSAFLKGTPIYPCPPAEMMKHYV